MCTSSAPQGLHIFHYFTVCCDLSGMAARSRAVRERESVIERERERFADTGQQYTGRMKDIRLN